MNSHINHAIHPRNLSPKAAATALLRPIVDATSQNALRDIILEAYKEHEAEMTAVA